NPSPLEKYQAAVASGDPIALAVQNVLRTRGVGKELRGVTVAQTVIEENPTIDDGAQTLDWTLQMLLEAFPSTDARRLDSTLIRAIARFFRMHGTNPKLREEKFIKALTLNGKRTSVQLKAEGTKYGTSGPGSAKYIVDELENAYARFNNGNRL